ncbi:hypothetical protein JQ628_11285 [Bradyrhizobium lablabi]|nr:hypothetical protein [Bradyrhizobium lablabi]
MDQKRPTYREIMEHHALSTIDSGFAFYVVAFLMFVGLIAYAISKLVFG